MVLFGVFFVFALRFTLLLSAVTLSSLALILFVRDFFLAAVCVFNIANLIDLLPLS